VSPVFTLRNIASWYHDTLSTEEPSEKARVPALQRGLVWSPQQNELLWDSILRGFPIGALVVTRWSERLRKSAERPEEKADYHLLDGQQRCNAIALGYSDPFGADGEGNAESILWLDLEPPADQNSTRNFLVRMTTTSHPWGYGRDEASRPLPVRAVRESLEILALDSSHSDYRRPKPKELWPCPAAAVTPVPLAWLLLTSFDNEQDFWKAIANRAATAGAESGAKPRPWTQRVEDFCSNPDSAANRDRIFRGIRRAHAATLIALEAPEELLEVSEQEKTTDGSVEDVTNIEQLFQRLNRQGTRLDGEELAYSMIKAYWRDLEVPIDTAARGRMPQARMVSLGVRAALAGNGKENLPGPPTLSALRAIARNDEAKRQTIQTFIADELLDACSLVDTWLRYKPEINESGLLPVHVTSIAIGSRDVYLLLLHFARRMHGVRSPEGWSRTMQSLATLLHWFSSDQGKVVNRIYRCCSSELTSESISEALRASIAEGELHAIHSPKAVAAFLEFPVTPPHQWTWHNWIYREGAPEGNAIRQKQWEYFLHFRWNRELLLYAQRSFLAQRFPDYDPARKDLWESHNRPWDFDHLLAWSYVHNRKDGSPYREVCRDFACTIGNLRAWPFEHNRSDQADGAADKISNEESIAWSFVEADELKAFSAKDDTRRDPIAAESFLRACRGRIIRIYANWYEATGVGNLLPEPHESES